MNTLKRALLLSGLIFTSISTAETIVYTINEFQPTNLNGEKVIFIDQPENLLNEVFGELSSNPAQAQAQAIATIQSPNFQQKQQEIAQAYEGLIAANNLGLKKVPAIVFNGKYVVYGTSDVAQARAIFEKMGK